MKKSLIFYFSTHDLVIYDVSTNKLIKEKNYIANKLYFDSSGIRLTKKKVLSFGNKAYEYFDRTPYDIEVIPCFLKGKMADIQAQSMLISKIKDSYKLKYGYTTSGAYVLTTRYTDDFQLNLQQKSTGIKNINYLYVDDLILANDYVSKSNASIIIYLDNDNSFIMAASKSKLLFIRKLLYSVDKLDDSLLKYIKFNTTVSISLKQAIKIREKFESSDNDSDKIEISAINNKTSLPTRFTLTNKVYKNVNGIFSQELLKITKSIITKLPTNLASCCINDHNIFLCGPLAQNVHIQNMINNTFNVDSKIIYFSDLLSSINEYRSKNAKK